MFDPDKLGASWSMAAIIRVRRGGTSLRAMASKLTDLQDERLLDCISFPPPIPAELIEKLNIGGTLLQTKMKMEQNRGG
ncbi:unnamed protein product [Alternaria alternata]